MNRAPRLHERVRIVSGPYAGHEAVVVRLLHRRSPESWVELGLTPDGAPAPALTFGGDPDDPRVRHVLVEWDDMEPLVAGAIIQAAAS